LPPPTDQPNASVASDLLEQFGPAMYRVAVSVVQDRALAEDVVQDSLMRAWQKMDTFRGESSLQSWVLRITHNTAISLLRKRREQSVDDTQFDSLLAADDSPEQAAIASDQAARLWAIVGRSLDPLSRSILILREVQQLSYEEIADITDQPLHVVRARLFRARQRLADLLKEWK
jgi:RNA polymerase sigma-70 factor, ECF subfamily